MVLVDGFEIGLWWWDLNIVFGCCIECVIFIDLKWNFVGCDQGIDCWFDEVGWWWWCSGGNVVGQLFVLIGVENGKLFEEWDCLCVFVGFGGVVFFIIWYEMICVDDGSFVFFFCECGC